MAGWISQTAPPSALARLSRAEDAHTTASRAFAGLLDAASGRWHEPDDARETPIGVWRVDGTYRIHLPRHIDAHALVWRAQAAAKPMVATPVALRHVAGAWAEILPAVEPRGPEPVGTGLAVFDSDGLRAEYAFAWRLWAGQGWRPDPAPEPDAVARCRAAPWAAMGALDPVRPRGHAGFAENCGRCQRHALGRNDFALPLFFCRFECLKPGTWP